MISAVSNESRSAAGSRNAVWTTSFASRFTSMTLPMSRFLGYGDRIPPASSMPAVKTSSSSCTFAVASMLPIVRPLSSCPTTSPLLPDSDSWPMTFEVGSLISVTFEKFGPISVTRPARAPPATITASPSATPSSSPRSITMSRRASLDSRAITRAATVS